MQPINGNRLQQQIIPPRLNNSAYNDSASQSSKTPLRRNTSMLPEDVVNLSKDRSLLLALKKAPSAPVSAAESTALRDSFSVYA
jgi:hypothetical protein